LGRAFDKNKNPQEAIKAYNRFLKIWADADSNREEIKIAKERLGLLAHSQNKK